MDEAPRRLCRKCRYDLAGLGAGPCPECAEPFDPRDPATFTDGRLPVWTVWSAALLAGLPWAHILAVYVAFLAARIELGWWPQWMDDARRVPGGLLYFLAQATLRLAALAVPVAAVFVLACIVRGLLTRRRRPLLFAFVVCAAWGAAIALVRSDPCGASNWFY